MRTIIISLVLFFSALVAGAQVTLENTYSFSTTLADVSNEEYLYFLMDVPQKQCRIYNTYHVLQKTVNISVPEGYYLSDIKFVTRNLFNNDDLIELLYIYEKYVATETWYYYQYGMGIVNESGTQLLNLQDGAYAEIKKAGTDNKLLAYTYIYNPLGYYDVKTFVYALGGSADYIGLSGGENSMVFPNPANDQILVNTTRVPENFKGDFNLFTTDGLKVLSIPVRKGYEHAVPVSQLTPGMYIYSIRDKNKLIQSDKIVIR